ncbi:MULTISPECIES: metal-sulfur cluster assembly factor [unclassified Sporosarcina]|uniref:metal-sulfur cluster assembly factor n=1 Tax=unclassified Sporosarcina TaxID=2647733 RepID=UPI000C172C8C|nr:MULTISPECIES: metal-sulfur cluster assembly factor [unclassified Sporosarcina]PIC85046.1 DNA methyltransferase [Sporosarcina sp. P20a]PIC97904.1 DNA methyltransferase [Sporosarcina sp. P29]PID04421.1 DNA methyltransferase [Sporosarcina sp. P30]PID07604.1 DNA methyltransferase [Sporosarcina sp. P31]PID10788.1 DNA methyltransferase [Sporosarcina sp. P32b]
MNTEEEIKQYLFGALENVIDPELGIDIVNLGLVYNAELLDEGVAKVTMTLTSMGCPMGPQIVANIEQELMELPEVKDTVVDIIWNPPWSRDHMSRYAKIALGVR